MVRSVGGSDSGEIGGWDLKEAMTTRFVCRSEIVYGSNSFLTFGWSEGKREEERRESFLHWRCRSVVKTMTVR